MPKDDQARSSEQRYYVTRNEAEWIVQAAKIMGRTKSDFGREAVLAASAKVFVDAGVTLPVELRRFAQQGLHAPVRRDPDHEVDERERRILAAFDALRDALVSKK